MSRVEATRRKSVGEGDEQSPFLTMRRIGKTFGNGVTALADTDLTINQGDFVSLVGPSGCGKSTALRIISGLSQPTSGRLDWGGKPLDKGDIGFVFQEATLLPWSSVIDNIWLPLRLRGMGRKAARPAIEEALDRVGLNGFEDAVPRELSGGMKMRVSIARALVTKPRLLLMDEPFAALDEITRFQLNADLLHLWELSGWTVIFVTHSVFESVFLSNRIVVMASQPGRVFEEIAVDAPYPRDEHFRTSPEYAAICRQASDSLVRAMDASQGSV